MGLIKEMSEIFANCSVCKGEQDLLTAIYGREGLSWFIDLSNEDKQKVFKRLRESLIVLLPKERDVIDFNFGLDGKERLSLTQIRSKTVYTRDSFLKIKFDAIFKMKLACSEYIATSEGFEKIIKATPIQNMRRDPNYVLTRDDLALLGIEDLRLNKLAFNSLKRAGIHSMLDIIVLYANRGVEGFGRIDRIGKACIKEIITILNDYLEVNKIDIYDYMDLKKD